MHNQPRHAAGATAAPRRKLGMPAKPKRWNHQDELETMRGRKVIIMQKRGVEFVGELVEADQFAIKLRLSDGSTPILWKHDLSFVVLAA